LISLVSPDGFEPSTL